MQTDQEDSILPTFKQFALFLWIIALALFIIAINPTTENAYYNVDENKLYYDTQMHGALTEYQNDIHIPDKTQFFIFELNEHLYYVNMFEINTQQSKGYNIIHIDIIKFNTRWFNEGLANTI